MAEICIPGDQVPPDILHRLRAIGQRLLTETPSSSQALARAPTTRMTSEIDANGCDEVDGEHTFSRRTELDCAETEISSGGKGISIGGRPLGGGDVVSVLPRNSPEKRIEQCPQSGIHSHQDGGQELLVLHHQQQQQPPSQNPQQQQQSFQNLQQLHPAQLNPREMQGLYAKKLSPFKGRLVSEAVDDDSRVEVSGQSSRSPGKAEMDVSDVLTQRQFMRSPFISEAKASFAGNTCLPFQALKKDSRSASLGHASTRTDEDIVRIFPSTSGAGSGEVGHQQSPKVLTPPETPECEGKRKGNDVFTFDDPVCQEELVRQTFEKMSQLNDRIPARRDIVGLLSPRHGCSQSIRGGVCQGVLSKAPRSPPADLRLLHSGDAPARKMLKLNSLSCPNCPLPSQEDYRLQQRRNSLSPQPKRKLTFEHGAGSTVAPRSPLFLHSVQHQPRSYDTPGAPYPPRSPRQSATGAVSEAEVSRRDFPFCPYTNDGQQVLMGGRASTPGKLLQPFLSDLSCFQDRPGLNSSVQLHGGSVLGYGEDERDGAQSLYFQSGQKPYVPSGRAVPWRRRTNLDDEGDVAFCTCVVMERNFLQMAECAYKSIRRLDSSPADFERFRTELAQTNEILREAMELMKRIREMCDHHPRARR